ncbi:MAG: hypothetical protein JWP81_4712 [Ferruginibacter sp.]|nr:hypothetical protein [Ferruginibacter sp.]
MKTTLLFSTAVLLSMATFAQTTIKNHETVKTASTVQTENGNGKIESSGTASASSAVSSNAVNSTGQTAASAGEKGKTAIVSEKNVMDATVKAKKDQVVKKPAAEKEITVASAAKMEVIASEKDNKVPKNASLTGGASAKSIIIQNNGQSVKNEVAVVANSALVAGKQVKPAVVKIHEKINTVPATRIATISPVASSIKPVPVAIKATGNVKVNTGIRIQ